jgi:hypothetical protein
MKAGTKLPSLNSLIYSVCRGSAYKTGATVVSGVLKHTDKIRVIAGIGRPVDCYESSKTRVASRVFETYDTFYLPQSPKGARYFVDESNPVENVGIWFLFETIPICCDSFVPSAIIVGTEPLLREALKGRKFIPRAYFAEYAAMELQPCP